MDKTENYINTHSHTYTHMRKRFTINIDKELKQRIDRMPEVNWPEIAKRGILNKLKQLEKGGV